MNKKDLVRTVASDTGYQVGMVSDVIDSVLKSITECLSYGEKMVLQDFGVFKPTVRKEKIARNVRTGEQIVVPMQVIPDFKPGKYLKDIVKGAEVYVDN